MSPLKWWAKVRSACVTTVFISKVMDREIRFFCRSRKRHPSVYSPYVPNAHPVPHNGQRVVMGQRAMQLQSDPFLGWTNVGSRQFMVRQLNDHKGSIELEDLAGPGLAAFGEVCGELLARGHARSGDPRVIAGYLGTGNTFAEALANFGSALRRPDRKGLAGAAAFRQGKNELNERIELKEKHE